MNNLINLAYIGDPVLREPTRSVEIEKINTPFYQNIIRKLIIKMRELDGAGLAANQIFYSYRVCVIEVMNNTRYKNIPNIPLKILVNPKIEVINSENKFVSYEGCLSVPNLRGKVERYSNIKVSYYNEKGKFIKEKLNGFPAIVYQHEIDHLDGVLFTDRIKDIKTLVTYDNYLKYYEKEYIRELKDFIGKNNI